MTAASPGVISLFLANQYYPTHEAYLYALADAMKAPCNEGMSWKDPSNLPGERL